MVCPLSGLGVLLTPLGKFIQCCPAGVLMIGCGSNILGPSGCVLRGMTLLSLGRVEVAFLLFSLMGAVFPRLVLRLSISVGL